TDTVASRRERRVIIIDPFHPVDSGQSPSAAVAAAVYPAGLRFTWSPASSPASSFSGAAPLLTAVSRAATHPPGAGSEPPQRNRLTASRLLSTDVAVEPLAAVHDAGESSGLDPQAWPSLLLAYPAHGVSVATVTFAPNWLSTKAAAPSPASSC